MAAHMKGEGLTRGTVKGIHYTLYYTIPYISLCCRRLCVCSQEYEGEYNALQAAEVGTVPHRTPLLHQPRHQLVFVSESSLTTQVFFGSGEIVTVTQTTVTPE
jgi:hypothetical protein